MKAQITPANSKKKHADVHTVQHNVDTLSLHSSDFPTKSTPIAKPKHGLHANTGKFDMNTSVYYQAFILPSMFFCMGILLIMSVIH